MSRYSILTCQQWPTGSNGTIDAQYTLGGVPIILYPSDLLQNSGMCGNSGSTSGSTKYASFAMPVRRPIVSLLSVFSSLLGFLFCFCFL